MHEIFRGSPWLIAEQILPLKYAIKTVELGREMQMNRRANTEATMHNAQANVSEFRLQTATCSHGGKKDVAFALNADVGYLKY